MVRNVRLHSPTLATMGKPTFPTFPSKTWWFFYMRNKTLARLEGWSAIFDPAGSYRSRRNNQSMRERCCQLLALANGQLFSHINARQKWLGWKDDPLSRETLTQRGLRTLLYLSFHFPLAWSHITFNFSFVFFRSDCPVGWSAYGDSCYYLNGTVAQNQTDARKACQAMDGDLPIIKSATEDKFVFELIRNSETVTTLGTWLGLERDKNKSKSFHWIDNTPLEGGFNNWVYKEPNNQGGNEDCVHMYGKRVWNFTRPGKWNDYPCSCYFQLRHCPVILCQKPAY